MGEEMSARRALVTGASGGIGAAIARRLAADGCHVILHGSSNPDALKTLCSEIEGTGGSAEIARFDLRDAAAVSAGMEAVLAEGAVQVLVQNAGIHDDALLASMADEQWDGVVDVSLNGFYRVARPLIVPMIRTRWGRILCISSISALIGNRGQVNYAAAKAGLHGAVKALALEYADRGVTVNAVAPGIIRAPDGKVPIPKDRLKALVPMKHAGEPEDVAELVGFLASDGAGYITGQIVSVSGGAA
jgi:3-oxoacyl-[acyl-carrier protein] reductase